MIEVRESQATAIVMVPKEGHSRRQKYRCSVGNWSTGPAARGFWVGVVCFIALSGIALACRFNVRDVGFVDLGSQQYRFYGLIGETTPVETATAIQEISAAAFFNTNVQPEVLGVAEAQSTGWYQRAGSPPAPAGILVSPDGERSLALPLLEDGENLQDTLWTHMEAVFESPARGEVLAKAIDTYGVIVLVEGSDATENGRIRQVAERVIARVEASLGELEKEIQKPPVLHVISTDQAESEKVFLWSLGINTDVSKEPFVSVIYARGRQIGQGLKGADIDETSLFNVVRTIGLNCECGLDRSWMQGPMMPLKWDSDTQARVAEQLGFDAEDPLIKMEMSQILSKADQARSSKKAVTADDSETDLDQFLEHYEGPEKSAESDDSAKSNGKSAMIRAGGYIALSFAGVIALLGGVIIVIRSRSNNR